MSRVANRTVSPCKKRKRRRKQKHGFVRFAWLLLIPVILALIVGIVYLRDEPENWTGKPYLERLYPQKYRTLVELYSEKWDVPDSVIYAVIVTESGFNADAVSAANACGLMQLTESTYEWLYAIRHEECNTDTIFIPSYNIDAGTQLLAWLYRQFGRWDYVYAAYNAGIGRVNSWLADTELSPGGELTTIPINETRVYVERVTEAEEFYRTHYINDENG